MRLAVLLAVISTRTLSDRAPRLVGRKRLKLVVIAGAGKCGTNALAYHLSEIAGFRTSRVAVKAQTKLNGFPGEVNYPCHLFGAKKDKSSGPVYERLLQRTKRDPLLALDKSANYLGDVRCAAQLKAAFPTARVVASVCSAASRLWSRQNHVNRDRKKDEKDGDLSKTVDWPRHIVGVARAQIEKLERFGWNGTAACRAGHATHVCKVLATSWWHKQVGALLLAFGRRQADVWLMEELLETPSAEIQARLRGFLGLPENKTTHSKKHVVVHSNANYPNYKLEHNNKFFLELKTLLDAHYAEDTAGLKELLPDKDIDRRWGGKDSVRPGQRRSWQKVQY